MNVVASLRSSFGQRLIAPGHTLVAGFAPLRERDLRLYLGGQSISLVGTWLQATAQSWVVWELARSGTALALASILSQVPLLLLGPLAGVWADHVDRRRLLIATQLGAMLLAFALAALIQAQLVRVWHVYALSLLLGIDTALGAPAERALVADLTGQDRVREAVALNQIIFQVGRILGPALAGIVLATLGAAPAFWLNGLSFLAAVASLLAIRPHQTLAPPSQGTVAALGEGLRFVGRAPRVQDLFVLGMLITVLAIPVMTLLPVVAARVLRGGPEVLGALTAASAVGSLAGLVAVLPAIRSISRVGILLAGAVAWVGGWFAVFALSASLPLSVASMVLMGLGGSVAVATGGGLLQVLAPPDMRARLQGLYATATYGLQPLGVLLLGFGADRVGATPAILADGCLVALGALLLLSGRPGLRTWSLPSDEGAERMSSLPSQRGAAVSNG